jgi:hypothetical protein
MKRLGGHGARFSRGSIMLNRKARRLASRDAAEQHRHMKSMPMMLAAAIAFQCGCERQEKTSTAEKTSDLANKWVSMDGMEQGKWQPINGAADIKWDDGNQTLWMDFGNELNGVRWTGELPQAPYELELEARRMSGNDFFCGLTFPVRSEKECVTFVVGGWGGDLVGISSIDGLDASENSTASMQEFEDQRWYRIRVRVETERLQAWIDERQMVDEDITERKLSLRSGQIEDCAPLGLASWATRAEMRGMRWRKPVD